MVQTRRGSSFATEHPLLSAIARGDSSRMAALCRTPSLAAASVGPGGFTPLHLCALLGDAASVPALVAAGVPVGAAITSLLPPSFLDLVQREVGTRVQLRHWYMHTGETPLRVATRCSHEAPIRALLEAGADPWFIVDDYYGSSLGNPLLVELEARYLAGTLEASGAQLAKLVNCVWPHPQRAKALLRAAVERAFLLPLHRAMALLGKAIQSGRVGTVRLLLKLGASVHEPVVGYAAAPASIAVNHRQSTILGVLLEAGAPRHHGLVSAVLRTLSSPMLTVLLAAGSIAVDTARPVEREHWTCPVLALLSIKPKFEDLSNHLQMAEMLAAAGYRPTVYKNCVNTYSPRREVVPAFDPLKEAPEGTFQLHFTNRYTLLPFDPAGWTPRSHRRYPPALQAAVRAVLLAAQRGTQRRAQLLVSGGEEGAQQPGSSAAGGHGLGRDRCVLLAGLPQELLLRILHLAARPVSAWVW